MIMPDFFDNDLTGFENAGLIMGAYSAAAKGEDGFLQAIQAADKMVAMKRQQIEKDQTAGFLQAITNGEDLGVAAKKFPRMNEGYLQQLAVQQATNRNATERQAAERTERSAERDEERVFQSKKTAEAEKARIDFEYKKRAAEQEQKEQEALDIQSGRASVGAGQLLQGQAPQPGEGPPSIDTVDAGFLREIQSNPQTPPGRAAIAAQIAREQIAKERSGFLDEAKKLAEIEKAQGAGVPTAPAGYRYTTAGNLEAIPGGPATKTPAYAPPSGYRYTASGDLERIPGGPDMSYKAPAGYRYTPDGNLEAVPGGPADMKAEIARDKKKMMLEGLDQKATIIIGSVDSALEKAGMMETGLVGSVMGKIPGTDAFDMRKDIDTIKANIGFQELSAMRQSSPTGGALGQVAVQELDFLQSVLGSLDASQSGDELKKKLEAIKRHYTNWKKAVEKDLAGGGKSSAPAAPRPDAAGGTSPGLQYLQKYGGPK